MKRLILIFIAMFISSITINAQEKFDKSEKDLQALSDSINSTNDSDDIIQKHEYKSTRIENDENKKDDDWEEWENWDDWRQSRKNEWKSSKKRGFFRGGAGGWDYYLMDLNVDEINAKLTDIGLNPFDKQIYLSGGGGWGFIGHGIRIGGLAAHGAVKSSGGSVVDNRTVAKDVTLSINFGGFLIEKVCHPFNKTELYFGTTIGGGNAHLKFDQWSEPISWDDAWNGYNNTYLDTSTVKFFDYQNEMSANYLTILPTIGFRYNIFRWAAVGVNVGYLYSKMNQEGWSMNGKTVSDVPEIDFSNIIYRVNIYFGG